MSHSNIITKDSVRACVCRDLSLSDGLEAPSVNVLISNMDNINLSKNDKKLIRALEDSLTQSAHTLYYILNSSLEANGSALTHPKVKHGLHCHRHHTLDELINLLYIEDSEAGDIIKKDLLVGGEKREVALDSLAERLLLALEDSEKLKATTKILVEDPKNSYLKSLLDSALFLINDSATIARNLYLRIYRESQAAKSVALVDSFSKQRLAAKIKAEEDEGAHLLLREKRLQTESPIESIVQTGYQVALERKITTLKDKLRKLLDDSYSHHRIATSGPKELQYSAAILRNQEQSEADIVKGEIRDSERERKWVVS